jgi:SNF2 family DNA or RNA helicase
MTWHLNHAEFGNKPWAVQTEAIRRSTGHAKFGYWLEMGLGKTALTLNDFIASDDTDIHLVVAPNSFKLDWALAPDEWGVPWMPTGYWPKHPLPFDQTYCQYSINYEAVREKETLRQLIKLCEQRKVMLTIDESTAIKNPGTSTFKTVLELAKRAKIVRELNGTPLTQSTYDYYGQLRALGQLNGMEPVVFRNKFCELGGYFNRQIVGSRNEDELARILDSCTFRALKKDWRKDLPPKLSTTVHLEMSNHQRQHYATLYEEFYALVDGHEISVEIVLAQMAKLRQVSSCILLDKGESYFFDKPKDNPKLKATLDIIAASPGKVIVSHFYRSCGQLLMDVLTKEGLQPARIQGDMSPEAITEEKKRFNDDSACRVLVGQQGATSRGHTLIGQKGKDRCSTLIFFDNDFSYYQRAQMEDRNHRGSQDTECNIFDLQVSPMCGITIHALTRKRDLANSMDDIVAEVRRQRR